MDVNDLRTLLLVIAFAGFAAIVAWAYSSRRKREFDEAARLPLDEDDTAEVNRVAAATKDRR